MRCQLTNMLFFQLSLINSQQITNRRCHTRCCKLFPRENLTLCIELCLYPHLNCMDFNSMLAQCTEMSACTYTLKFTTLNPWVFLQIGLSNQFGLPAKGTPLTGACVCLYLNPLAAVKLLEDDLGSIEALRELRCDMRDLKEVSSTYAGRGALRL